MTYESPALLSVGAVETVVKHTDIGPMYDNGTDDGFSLRVEAVLDIDGSN